MTEKIYDVAVIGGGPGGYVAAIRAAQLGRSVALIERENLGGICLNWGCIPTKALLRSAEVYTLFKHAAEFGIDGASAGTPNPAKMVQRSRKISKKLSGGIGYLLKKNGVTHVAGHAVLAGDGEVSVRNDNGEEIASLAARDIIVATGARAREVGPLKADGERIWTYRHALVADQVPPTLLVIGSGAIGIEFASFYAALGSQVTVVEAVDRILPAEDAEISALADKAFRKQGLTIQVSTTVEALETSHDGVRATLRNAHGTSDTVTYDRALVAIGIVGNVEGFGLDTLGVEVDRGHVVTDGTGKTNVEGIWAIGDVAGGPWLAHKASHEGVICAEAIAGLKPDPLNVMNIPGCTYASPQVASVGLTEAGAIAAGHEVRVGRFSAAANGKALALGENEGLIKTIFDATTGELLGAHMIGPEVTEQIQGYTIARSLESTEVDLMHTVFPHPTLSEMMHEAVLDAYGRAIHA